MDMIIKNITAKQNEKKQGYIETAAEGIKLPITIINGKEEGKKVLLTAGIHGAEYPGIQALIELSKEIEPKNIKGSIIIVPVANPGGFKAIAPWIVPEDGKNLNREFPGDEKGTVSQQIAYTITNELQLKSDFYIDLHSGDLYESLTPYVYYPSAAEENIKEQAKDAASVLSVPYRVKSASLTGAYNSAAVLGVPSLLIERGGRGQWTAEEVHAYKRDIYRLLTHLGLINSEEVSENKSQQEITKVFYPEASTDGLWYPAVSAGDMIKKGDFLGKVCDFFGNELESFVSEADGVVLYLASTLSIRKKDPAVAYGEISK